MGGVLEMSERAGSLDGSPEFAGGLVVVQRLNESLHLAVFVELELVRRVDETTALVSHDGPRNVDLLPLPIGQVREALVVAFLHRAHDKLFHAHDSAGLSVEANVVFVRVKLN